MRKKIISSILASALSVSLVQSEASAVSTAPSDAPVVETELNYTPLESDVLEPEVNSNKKNWRQLW